MESIRKDAECTYGIMKKRHRVLKVPSLRHSLDAVNCIARCCGILHNMLLVYDGLDKLGDDDEHWEIVRDITQLHGIDDGVEGFTDSELLNDIRMDDIRTRMSAVDQMIRNPTVSVVHDNTDRGLVGNYNNTFDPTEEHSGYMRRVRALATHMHEQFKKGQLMWLKKARNCIERAPAHGCPGPWNGTQHYTM